MVKKRDYKSLIYIGICGILILAIFLVIIQINHDDKSENTKSWNKDVENPPIINNWSIIDFIDEEEIFSIANEWSNDSKLFSISIKINETSSSIISSSYYWFVSFEKKEELYVRYSGGDFQTQIVEASWDNWHHSEILWDLRNYEIYNLSYTYDNYKQIYGGPVVSMFVSNSYFGEYEYYSIINWGIVKRSNEFTEEIVWINAENMNLIGSSEGDGSTPGDVYHIIIESSEDSEGKIKITTDYHFYNVTFCMIENDYDQEKINVQYFLQIAELDHQTPIMWNDTNDDEFLSEGDTLEYQIYDFDNEKEYEFLIIYRGAIVGLYYIY